MKPMLCAVLVGCGGVKAPGDVPTNDKDLLDWATEGGYLRWTAEASVHESDGPHFGAVRVYFNPELAGSYDGTGPLPLASAAVKELYGDTTEVAGWSVMVKVEEGTGGDTWYWWESFEGETLIDGVGESPCVGCHAAGVDYVLSALPDF